MKPLVSILIPAYNAEKWLADTLRSALAQTWNRTEIIIVDDGSKDGTLALAQSFELSAVKVYAQMNQGAAAARNKAFSLCHGDYIQWLDADDLLGAGKIAEQMEAMGSPANPKVLLSGEWGSFMYRPSGAKFIKSGLWCDLPKAEWLMRKMEQNVYMQTASWLVSRELTEAAGPWDTRLLGDDDGEYFCRVLMASEGVKFVPGARVYYRQAAAGSLSYIGASNRKRDAQWISMDLHMGYLRSLDDSSRARAACVRLMQNWMFAFYPERMDIVEKARKLAQDLGGTIEPPRLPRKYFLLRVIFGWPVARRIQVVVQMLRWRGASYVDRVYNRIKRPRGTPEVGI